MAGKTTAKSTVKNGVDKKEVSMTYIDDILLRLNKTESDIDKGLNDIDNFKCDLDLYMHELGIRVNKVESRLGI